MREATINVRAPVAALRGCLFAFLPVRCCLDCSAEIGRRLFVSVHVISQLAGLSECAELSFIRRPEAAEAVAHPRNHYYIRLILTRALLALLLTLLLILHIDIGTIELVCLLFLSVSVIRVHINTSHLCGLSLLKRRLPYSF